MKANEHFNPPIRGSIEVVAVKKQLSYASQSPYKGFNRYDLVDILRNIKKVSIPL